jgi:hypothetical protein
MMDFVGKYDDEHTVCDRLTKLSLWRMVVVDPPCEIKTQKGRYPMQIQQLNSLAASLLSAAVVRFVG